MKASPFPDAWLYYMGKDLPEHNCRVSPWEAIGYLKRCKMGLKPHGTQDAQRFFKQRELEYKRLRKAEKELYNRDTGLEWVLIPKILSF